MLNKQLAKITRASLEIKERGILNFWIHVDYEEGSSQGIGGYALDNYDEDKKTRVGTAYGCEMIRQLLLTLEVNDFSQMKDKMIWVLGKGEGLGFDPKGIKTLNVNDKKGKSIIFKHIYTEFS